MQATVYANLTTRRLTTTLGGSAISFPSFVQGDKVRIGMRFAESLEGSPIEVERVVTNIRASIGFVDARPTSGFFVLSVDGEDTVPVAHDATAGTVKTALAGAGLDDAVVSKQDGSWIISTVSGVCSALRRLLLQPLHRFHSLQIYDTYEVMPPYALACRCGL